MIEPSRIADAWRDETEVALVAAGDAADLILSMRSSIKAQIKADGTIVTAADLAAAELIRKTILEAFPDDAVLTEEDQAATDRLSRTRCWVVDPLDGTEKFAKGYDSFDVFVTLAREGELVVAVSVQPVTGIVMLASAGGGCHVRESGRWRQLEVAHLPRNPVIGTRPWLGAPANLAFLEPVVSKMGGTVVLPVAGVSPRSLVTDLDAIVGMFPHGRPSAVWEWDVAPYDLMMREAGGWASDLDGVPLRFN
ncbi:MAG TPA: inositol monophosphatase family protein, partial [Thermomicrobiales bacterium]|nr:inositol monophosphatase family protein [Thermomicrobiales bacterium]